MKSPRIPLREKLLWLLAGMGLTAGLLVVEASLRVCGLNFPDFWRKDSVLGLGLKPRRSGWYVDEGRAFVQVNSVGFHDSERIPAKPPKTWRVIVLGDSFTEAVQVPLEDTFEKVAETDLESCPALKGRRVEVMNWGVRGFGTVQEAALLKLRGWDFSPDAVVLANYPETDLEDNLRALEPDQGPPMVTERNGRFDFTAAVEDARRRMKEELERNPEDFSETLWTLRLLRTAVRHWHHRGFWRRGAGNDPLSADYPSRLAYREPADEKWRNAWRVQEGLLELMARETKARRVPLLMLLVSSPAQVHPDEATRARIRKLWQVSDLAYPNRRLAAAAARLGFGTLDSVPLLDAEVARTREAVHDFPNTELGVGHWNSAGHRVVGRALARRLCALAER